MMTPAVLPAALLLLLQQGSCSSGTCCCGNPCSTRCCYCPGKKTPFSVVVSNSVTPSPNKTYNTYVVYRGILLGGLRKLQDSKKGFTFNYTENYDYGPFLQSVNGLEGSPEEHTYWQLLVKTTDNQTIAPNVGIGCYIPKADEQIILNYKKYEEQPKTINHTEL